MREGEEQSLDISVPGDSPIGVGSDSLSRSAGTNDEFKCSNLLSFTIVGSHCIDSGEDMVEVDRSPKDDVGPLSVRELGASG